MNAALLNSLWQGTFVTAIAALVTLLVPRRNAATRYAVWFTALLTLAALPFLNLWHPTESLNALPTVIVHTASAPSRITDRAATASGSWIALVWIVGVTLSLLRLALSYARIVRIVRRATPAPELGAGVMTSDDVAIPIAAGLFSPAIIIPTNLAAALEPVDLASIVAHERAHIRRMDVAGNLVARVLQACLFFNPWVYVVGRQLVKEREAACDDWAVHAMRDPSRYASCLARLAQARGASRVPLLTPSAIGSRHMLVGRIARLLDGKGTELKVNYLVLGASVLSLAILAVLLQTSEGLASAGFESAASSDSQNASNPYLSPKCNADVKPLSPAMPNISKADYKAKVSANALVTVGPDGHPIDAKIVKSSGSAAIDRAAVDAAMHSTYSPKMEDCKKITGQYLFQVDTGP
jgi:TonB family protein